MPNRNLHGFRSDTQRIELKARAKLPLMYCRLCQIPHSFYAARMCINIWRDVGTAAAPAAAPAAALLSLLPLPLLSDDADAGTAGRSEAYESSLLPTSHAATYLVHHIAHQQQQHQRQNERREDQQEPVKIAGHRHRMLKPTVPGESTQFLHAATASIAHASLGAASIRATAVAGRTIRSRHVALYALRHSRR